MRSTVDCDLRRFRRLVDTAVIATVVLVVVGGVVRVSDSGLGCGAAGSGVHGWPLCGGRLLPLVKTSMIIEYTHRLLAAVVLVLVALAAWQAVRRLRDRRWIVRGALAAVGLLLFQAVLGGLTVEHGLRTVLVATHLGTAMLLLGTLIALSWTTRPPRADQGRDGQGVLRVLGVASAAFVLMTIVAGGVIAGTERRGTGQAGHVEGAHLACGRQFPTCDGAWLPYGRSEMIDIQLVHRTLMLATVLAMLAFCAVAVRRHTDRRWPLLLGTLLAAQVLLGALNVWLGEHAELVVAHLALGTLLWGAVVAAVLALWPVPRAAI